MSSRVGLLPIILGVSTTVTMVLVFIISVATGHVTPYMPYISETGAYLPESGIFTFLMTLSAFVGFHFMFVRYKLVEELNKAGKKTLSVLNHVTVGSGILSLLGLLIVVAYPVTTVPIAHYVGAFVFFYIGIAYCILQTIITYMLYPDFNGITIFRIRLFIVVLASIAAITMTISGNIGKRRWNSVAHEHSKRERQPDDKGFDLLTISSTAEWIVGICFVCFFVGFRKEFRKTCTEIKIYPLVPNFELEIVVDDVVAPPPSTVPQQNLTEVL
ncbi:Uncharacterised protein g3132 [Pycnogonum litorale]